MSSVDQAIAILLSSSGLARNQVKLAVYYAIATWAMHLVQMFPILEFLGPPGTGKTSALKVLAHWCKGGRIISGKFITPAALRDELEATFMRTAAIEEADEASNLSDCEQLYATRCSPTTGKLTGKEMRDGTWRQTETELYGATILHYRRALVDQATGSRTIAIETRFREGKYAAPEDDGHLALIFKGLSEVLRSSDMATGRDRVHDIWAPLLAVGKLANDKDWLTWQTAKSNGKSKA